MNTLTTWYHRVPWRVRDVVEKIVSTYWQALVVILLDTEFFVAPNASIALVAAVAAVPAVITLGLNVLQRWMPDEKWPPLAQAAFRVVRTAIATGGGLLVAAPVFDFSAGLWSAAVAAVGASALAGLKAELALHVGDRTLAGLLPRNKPVPKAEFNHGDYGDHGDTTPV